MQIYKSFPNIHKKVNMIYHCPVRSRTFERSDKRIFVFSAKQETRTLFVIFVFFDVQNNPFFERSEKKFSPFSHHVAILN